MATKAGILREIARLRAEAERRPMAAHRQVDSRLLSDDEWNARMRLCLAGIPEHDDPATRDPLANPWRT